VKISPSFIPVILLAAVVPLRGADNAAMLAGFKKELAAIDLEISKAAKPTVSMYSRRGDMNFFLSNFDEAVKDYRKMIEIDPAQDGPHWRLGIALYFAGDAENSAKQFEKYHAQDVTGTDRETGIWHFIARAGIDGVSSARLQMLRYSRPDREPFNGLYDLFADVWTTEEFFRDLSRRGLTTDNGVMFYAQLYAGINEDLNGRRDAAIRFLGMAASSEWGRKAKGGSGYMWQVARVLLTALEEAKKAEKAGASEALKAPDKAEK
jgi:tetratricopeptide (TPR) repeat protein